MSKTPKKLHQRAFRLLWRILLVLCVLFVMGSGGALVWLRTPGAETTLTKLIVKSLADQGIKVRSLQLSGPLPEQIVLRNLELADDLGIFLRMESATARINFSALLKGALDITEITLSKPELFRAPQLPPAAESASSAGSNIVLPVDILLSSLRLEQARLHIPKNSADKKKIENPTAETNTAAISGIVTPSPTEPDQVVTVDMVASVSLIKDILTARIEGTGQDLQKNRILLRLQSRLENLLLGKELRGQTEMDIAVAIDGKEYPASFTSQFLYASPIVELSRLEVQGLGLNIKTNGNMNLDTRKVQIALHLIGDEGSSWLRLLQSIAALPKELDETTGMTAKAHITCTASAAPTIEEAQVSLHVDTIAPFQAGFAGPVDLDISATGSMHDLHSTVALTSPGLTIPSGKIEELQASVNANIQRQDDGETSLAGSAKVAIGNSPGGALDFATDWKTDLDANGLPLTALVKNLNLHGVGLNIEGSLTSVFGVKSEASPLAENSLPAPAQATAPVSISSASAMGATPTPSFTAETTPPPTTATTALSFPALAGSIRVAILDWQKLGAFTGVSLEGKPAHASVQLGYAGLNSYHAQNLTQSAQLSLSLPFLQLQEGTNPPTLVLHGVEGDIGVLDLWKGLGLTANVQLGQGKAGPLGWGAGKFEVKGAQSAGTFTATLLHEKKMSSPTISQLSAGGKTTRAFGSNGELLRLQGDYNQKDAYIRLTQFFMQPPQKTSATVRPVELRLVSPLLVSFTEGISVKGLNLSFSPSGKLTGEASLLPHMLQLKANLEALPFAILSPFTDTPLPGGDISVKAEYRSSSVNSQEAASSASAPFGIVSVRAQTTGMSVKTSKIDEGAPPAFAYPAMRVSLDARLDAKAGDGLARAPGIFHLLGTGSFGIASASNQAASSSTSGKTILPGASVDEGESTFSPARGTTGKKNPATQVPQAGQFSFAVPISLSKSGVPLPSNHSPFNVKARWLGQVADFWQYLPLPGRSFSGTAQVDLAVAGSLAEPKPTASAYLAGGRYEDILLGLFLRDITLEAHSTPEQLLTALVSVGDGNGGTVALEATLPPIKEGKVPTLTLRGQLNHLQPLHRDDLSLRLSGAFGASGPLNALGITGDIIVEQGDLNLNTKLGGGVQTLEVETKVEATQTTPRKNLKPKSPLEQAEQKKSAASTKKAIASTQAGKTRPGQKNAPQSAEKAEPTCDVSITIPRSFFIRASGLDSEWQGKLRITGKASEPALVGSLRPVRGYFDLLTKSFAFSGGEITFAGGSQINPGIQLELTHKGPEITAVLHIEGSAKKPAFKLESRPPLPQDEVLGYVLFGKSIAELSRFEALQLANSLRELAGTGGAGFNPLAALRKTVGIDVLRIGNTQKAQERTTSGSSGEGNLTSGKANGESGEETGGATLEAGKYINDSIYIGIEQGATQESTAVRVEVELLPSLNLEGKTSTRATEVGVGWKKDY